jgi:hypothetical protein
MDWECLLSEKVGHDAPCCQTSPTVEASTRLELVELAPKHKANGLEQVGGVFSISDNREDVRVQLALVATEQIGKQIVSFLFVHPNAPHTVITIQESRSATFLLD